MIPTTFKFRRPMMETVKTTHQLSSVETPLSQYHVIHSNSSMIVFDSMKRHAKLQAATTTTSLRRWKLHGGHFCFHVETSTVCTQIRPPSMQKHDQTILSRVTSSSCFLVVLKMLWTYMNHQPTRNIVGSSSMAQGHKKGCYSRTKERHGHEL